jgi:hypothetical protein
MNGEEVLAREFLDLVDAYCSGPIDDAEFHRLQAMLLDSEDSRRYFVEYFHHHTELQFAVRAGHATDAVLDQLTCSPAISSRPIARIRSWRTRPKARWLMGVAVGIALASSTFFALRYSGLIGSARSGNEPLALASPANIAWLINAQDCIWTGKNQKPGREMRSGKVLRLDRGLAEIEFDRGARVILQGPAGLELLSGSKARLLYGTLTARVPAQASGFTVLSPNGKVVDLGTEFGLSVSGAGSTSVRVFRGLVEAFPLPTVGRDETGVTIHQDQTAWIDGRTVAVDSRLPEKDGVAYIRAILPPPVRTPRILTLEFTGPTPNSLLDSSGRGTGLKSRLPGTGDALPERDPNLRLVPERGPERGALELTTTRSDLNTQERISTGEYLGFRLSDLGFTGKEDFEISATILKIPGLKVVGQFGLYAGVNSAKSIRGGLISWPNPDSYRHFLVNNPNGEDTDIYEVGLMTTGDDLRLTLRRAGGRYSLQVDNLTQKSSSTLEIAHPAFLDAERDLHVGLFGANTQSDQSKTLTIREVTVTVWTTQPESPTILQTGSRD